MNIPRGRSSFPAILVELHFGILVFVERGKPEDPEWTRSGPGVDPRSKDENQQQTKPTSNVKYGNRTQAQG